MSLAGVLLAVILLGIEVWVVAIAALGYVVSREAVTAWVLIRAAILLGASAILYVALAILLGIAGSR
jgi:hypothetical protein